MCKKLKMPRTAFQKCDVITFTFFAIAQQKQRYCFEIVCVVVCMYLDYIYPVFFDNLTILYFHAIIIENEIVNFGVKIKK